VIIDVHGHYTTAPAEQQRFRVDQLAALDDPTLPPPAQPKISDDEIRESIELNQFRILRERGGDLMLFSPKASGMEHHVERPGDRNGVGKGIQRSRAQSDRAVPGCLRASGSAPADSGR
jgi:hypothetical protein